jgi:hypothetical protein
LIEKGRSKQALDMLVKYYGEGNASDPLVVFEYDEITAALTAEKEVGK